MAESVIGALRVVLGLDTAAFQEGIKQTQNSLGGFVKQITAIASGIQLQKLVEELAGKFKELSVGVIETADKIGKASEKYGIAVENLSALKYAAEQADVPFDSLQKGFKALAKSAQDAANGTGEAAQAFKIIGVNAKDSSGNIKDTYQLFLQVADGIAKFGDGLGKTSLAAAVFGKRFGPDIIPLLNQGSAGIQTLTDRAKQLGLVLTKETTDAAQEFNDRMKDVGAVTVGVATIFTANFLPAMAKSVDSLVKWAIDSKVAENTAQALARTVLFLRDNVDLVVKAFEIWIAIKIIDFMIDTGKAVVTLVRSFELLATIKQIINAISLITVARFVAIAAVILAVTGAIPAFNEALTSVADTVGKMMPKEGGKLIESLGSIGDRVKALTKDWTDLKGEIGHEAFGPPIELMNKLPQAPIIDPKQSELAKKFKDTLRDLDLQAADLAFEFNGLAPGFASVAKGFQDMTGFGKNFGTTIASLSPEAQKLNDRLLNIAAIRLTVDFLSPWQLYEIQLERINVLYDQGKIGIETYEAASLKAAASMNAAYGSAAQAITGPLSSAFSTLAQMNSKYAGIAKAAAIANATVSTYVAANKAFESLAAVNVPLAYAAAAAAVVAGLANVAKIASTNTNFATGGSFRVGGGMTSVDSRLVAFHATPGEMVDIRRPGQEGGAGGGAMEIQLKAPRTRDFFSDNVRELVDVLNAAAPDGYRLKIT